MAQNVNLSFATSFFSRRKRNVDFGISSASPVHVPYIAVSPRDYAQVSDAKECLSAPWSLGNVYAENNAIHPGTFTPHSSLPRNVWAETTKNSVV
jgi:hypothetical protein